MYRRRQKSTGRQLDILHIVLSLIVVVMAVIAFVNPNENMMLFPFVFFFASMIRLGSVVICLRSEGHGRLNLQDGLDLALGLALLLLAVISARSIW